MSHRIQCSHKWIVTLIALVLSACGPVSSNATTSAPPTLTVAPPTPTLVASTVTPPPTSPVMTLTPPPDQPATPTTADDLAAELAATLTAALPPADPDNPGMTFAAVEVISLGMDDAARQLFGAHSSGLAGGGPRHFVAVHAHDGSAWQALDQIEIEWLDYLFAGSLTSRNAADVLWLELTGGVGAHGTCYYLLRWDGTRLHIDLSNCHSSFASAGIVDLNEDDLPDVILNLTDDYVYCYACSVRRPALQVFSWTGTTWVELSLRRLPDDAPAAAKAVNDHAVDLAQAGLWLDAALTINDLAPIDAITGWNRILINTLADMHAEAAEISPVPLLNYVFYGDYESAVAILREYPPQDIFTPAPRLFEGTPAQGYETVTAELIRDQMNLALPLQLERAAAYYLRGWAQYLVDPASPALAQPDLERADALAPTDPLYADSLFYFINDVLFR